GESASAERPNAMASMHSGPPHAIHSWLTAFQAHQAASAFASPKRVSIDIACRSSRRLLVAGLGKQVELLQCPQVQIVGVKTFGRLGRGARNLGTLQIRLDGAGPPLGGAGPPLEE